MRFHINCNANRIGSPYEKNIDGPGFIGKLMGVFIDCEKMVAGDFEAGIQNLKNLVEKK